jgi:type II restriction/modification system DNA methylase subunit YeeA
MKAEAFIDKWRHNTRNEAAASKEHFLDLCSVLDTPTPNSDPTGATYAFEKGVKKAAGSSGWADVWKRGCFGWEYKSRGEDLEKAHDQLLRYAGALENPPLLISSDMDRLIIRTNWTNTVSERHDFALNDIRDVAVRRRLTACWTKPELWLPAVTRQALTEKAAADFAELAKRLRTRGHDPQAVAHFVNRLVFCLFADDVGLLPDGLFDGMLSFAAKLPRSFADAASDLFRAMGKPGGRIGFQSVQWFNGGLFDDDTALPLEKSDILLLQNASSLDWSEIDPSILGTLFERGLDPDKRSQLGAHYTDRAKIDLLVNSVVVEPLLIEWSASKEKISANMDARAEIVRGEASTDATAAKALAAEAITEQSRDTKAKLLKARDARRDKKAALLSKAQDTYRTFLDRLRAFRVLDPACGSGNFLYVSLQALKDLEQLVAVEAEVLGLEPSLPMIGPEAVLGIELNPYAAELARVSVWIGHIQWARRNGYPAPSDPVLRTLDTIECRDAVLTPEGATDWPAANAIVGNPPFLGTKKHLSVLGPSYVERLRAAYTGRIPASSDFVCYWFERAREEIAAGRAEAVGFVATKNIRAGYSRTVLDRIQLDCPIFKAWDNEPWTLNGAAVRVALICFGRDQGRGLQLNGVAVKQINADLSATAADLTAARRLATNAGIAFSGTVKGGSFDVPGDVARGWLLSPCNGNGCSNADVLVPWVNASDIVGRRRGMWLVDFGLRRSEEEAAFYSGPFAHVVKHVRPRKSQSTKPAYAKSWWLLAEPCPGLRQALAPLHRFIATPTGTSHRVFVWQDVRVQPDHQLVAIARDDDTTFGILHSRLHEAWTRRLSSSIGVGDDPRYNPGTVFETFPFPDKLSPNMPASTYAHDLDAQCIAAAAQALMEARERWLNPPELVNRVPEVVPGFPDRLVPKTEAAASTLKKRTLTALYNTRGTPEGTWLDNLHRDLDAAVAAAYGWPADISEEEALAKLLEINLSRAAKKAAGYASGAPSTLTPAALAKIRKPKLVETV